jgi:hypothetical protein
MNKYEIEIKAKLTVFAFSPSDASDAIEEAIREAESFGAEVKDLSFVSINEII